MLWLLPLVALLAGAANPLQTAANAQLQRDLHQPMLAALAVYVTGLAGCLLLLLFNHRGAGSVPLAQVHWWAWLGGLVSIVSTVVGLTLAHRLGSGLFTGLSLSASVIMSVVLDQFGLLGFSRHPLSPLRSAGCALLIAGVWMVARG